MSELKFSIFNYLNHFGLYDYIAYIWLFLTFFILLILSLIFIRKFTKLSLLSIFFAFILLFIGPFVLKYFLDITLRPVEIHNIKYQKLHFSNTLIIDCDIKNISKNPFTLCQINTKVYLPSKSKIKIFINKLKPIRYKTILDKRRLSPGETMSDRIIFYNFAYNKDINISIDAQCYGANE